MATIIFLLLVIGAASWAWESVKGVLPTVATIAAVTLGLWLISRIIRTVSRKRALKRLLQNNYPTQKAVRPSGSDFPIRTQRTSGSDFPIRTQRTSGTSVRISIGKPAQTPSRSLSFDDAVKITRMREDTFLKKAKECFVAFDFETTGFSREEDEIIEVGAVRYINGVMQDSFTELVNPLMDIPEDSIRIHGITDEMVENCRTIDEVLPDFLSFIGSDPIVAHNAPFDVGFLKNAMESYGIPGRLRYHDSLTLSRKYYDWLPNHKLTTVAKAIGCPVNGAHRSLADCIAVGDIVNDIILKAEEKKMMASEK